MRPADKRILDCISSPQDLHLLGVEELGILAGEIRQQIIATTSKTGGHVASSLGAVEIILACHSVLDAPEDKLVFDVGHQSYAHKLVTGRLGAFASLRAYGGLSGFPKPSESPFDTHPSGHASDSLSVASGFAKAKVLTGSSERVVAIIGDAALAGGMAFEALNYIGSQQLPMVIILNDNEMSISRNVGALMRHLGNVRSTRGYRQTRDFIQERMEHGGRVSNAFVELGRRMKDSTKHMFLPDSMIYEQLGIVCTPPINGNSIAEMQEMLQLVLPMDCPVLIHAVTKKGAGYGPAEADPVRFHGISPYNPATGETYPKPAPGPKFTDVFGSALVQEAEADERIVAITAAMEEGTGLRPFHERFPERFIDVGIAEEQAVGIDVALAKRDVIFALDRAGLVGDDGPTHHGAFDIAFMRLIPSMRVLVPSDADELRSAVHTALRLEGPVSIRYPRGCADAPGTGEAQLLDVGRALKVRKGADAALLAWGRPVRAALMAAEELAREGIACAVYDMRWAKPIDAEVVREAAACGAVITLEEGSVIGGAGSGVLELLAAEGLTPRVKTLGLPDSFAMQGDTSLLLEDAGLDAPSICAAVRDLL